MQEKWLNYGTVMSIFMQTPTVKPCKQPTVRPCKKLQNEKKNFLAKYLEIISHETFIQINRFAPSKLKVNWNKHKTSRKKRVWNWNFIQQERKNLTNKWWKKIYRTVLPTRQWPWAIYRFFSIYTVQWSV